MSGGTRLSSKTSSDVRAEVDFETAEKMDRQQLLIEQRALDEEASRVPTIAQRIGLLRLMNYSRMLAKMVEMSRPDPA